MEKKCNPKAKAPKHHYLNIFLSTKVAGILCLFVFLLGFCIFWIVCYQGSLKMSMETGNHDCYFLWQQGLFKHDIVKDLKVGRLFWITWCGSNVITGVPLRERKDGERTHSRLPQKVPCGDEEFFKQKIYSRPAIDSERPFSIPLNCLE